MLDERVAYIENDTVMLKEEFVNELLKFGKYFVFFNGNEFAEHVNKWCIDNNVSYMGRPVEYCDIQSAYTVHDIFNRKVGVPYFKKDIAYKNQNEWRLILLDKDLIPAGKEFFVMKIGSLTTAKLISEEDFKNFKLDLN